MRLITAKEFAAEYFSEDSAPDLRTIRSWVESGKLPGRTIGTRTYVDAEAFEVGDDDPVVAALVAKVLAA